MNHRRLDTALRGSELILYSIELSPVFLGVAFVYTNSTPAFR